MLPLGIDSVPTLLFPVLGAIIPSNPVLIPGSRVNHNVGEGGCMYLICQI